MDILITGGAGFVGSSLAVFLSERGFGRVVCLDNLKRRGSELTLPRLKRYGIRFVHGDVRNRSDMDEAGAADILIECSAEPSVLAGYGGSPLYLVDSNLSGALNCFEWARRCGAGVVFMSTSRVYPYDTLARLPLVPGEDRFEWRGEPVAGAGPQGVAEDFPLGGVRSLYGATKLAAELLLAEYGATYGVPWVVNRCGVLTGPWQFGKTDQGVFMYWLLAHRFGRPLKYIGYGGKGLQVRDLLHVDDLAELTALELSDFSRCCGKTYNVGGGTGISLSLRETTELCRRITGNTVSVGAEPEERPADIPWYVSDCRRVRDELGWKPERKPHEIMKDMLEWINAHEERILSALE